MKQGGKNLEVIQAMNRTLLLRLLQQNHICSRANLSEQSGLKQATITNIINAITILCRHEMWVLIIDTALTLVCMLMLTDMYLNTDYTINGDILHIRCGVLFSMRLPITIVR